MENTEEKKVTPKKIKSIVVDTFTAIQKNDILSKWNESKVTKHEDWKDYGVDIVMFVKQLQDLGFNCVGVLGYEGSGKTYGMKFLESGTNIHFNADNKDITYKGGKAVYGTKMKPTHYMKIPKTYDDIIAQVTKSISKGSFVEEPVAFLIAHIEDYKSGDKVRQRMKTFGKLSNKANIEDMLTMCYYTEVIKEGNEVQFKLRTKNNGFDSCRSLEQQHDSLYIDNNFQLILDSIQNY